MNPTKAILTSSYTSNWVLEYHSLRNNYLTGVTAKVRVGFIILKYIY